MVDLSLFDMSGKKCLVTGGSSGIGKEFALALANAGAEIGVASRNRSKGIEVVDEIVGRGGKSIYLECDVTDENQVFSVVAEFVSYFGRLDVAINNAGVNSIGNSSEYSRIHKSDWDNIISTNLTGVWLCSNAQAKQMMAQEPAGGKIINTASTAAKTVGSTDAYSASKAAVVHLTRSLAVRFSPYNITVNCISPDLVITPMIAPFLQSSDVHKTFRKRIPLGYMQRASDLHGPIIFLSSSASDYITGHELVVDGGVTVSNEPPERKISPRVDFDTERQELSGCDL